RGMSAKPPRRRQGCAPGLGTDGGSAPPVPVKVPRALGSQDLASPINCESSSPDLSSPKAEVWVRILPESPTNKINGLAGRLAALAAEISSKLRDHSGRSRE